MDLYFWSVSESVFFWSACFWTEVAPEAVFLVLDLEDGLALREDRDADLPPRFRCLDAPPLISRIAEAVDDKDDDKDEDKDDDICLEESINNDGFFPKTEDNDDDDDEKCLASQVDKDSDNSSISADISIFCFPSIFFCVLLCIHFLFLVCNTVQ